MANAHIRPLSRKPIVLSWTFWDLLEPFEPLGPILEPSLTVLNLLEPTCILWTLLNFHESFWTCMNLHAHSWTILNLCTLDRYTLYPHQYFCLFLGLSHQKDPGLHFLCIFLIIGWTYRYTVRMSTFGNYQCACNDCWANDGASQYFLAINGMFE